MQHEVLLLQFAAYLYEVIDHGQKLFFDYSVSIIVVDNASDVL